MSKYRLELQEPDRAVAVSDIEAASDALAIGFARERLAASAQGSIGRLFKDRNYLIWTDVSDEQPPTH